jgi:hypothetical protein
MPARACGWDSAKRWHRRSGITASGEVLRLHAAVFIEDLRDNLLWTREGARSSVTSFDRLSKTAALDGIVQSFYSENAIYLAVMHYWTRLKAEK